MELPISPDCRMMADRAIGIYHYLLDQLILSLNEDAHIVCALLTGSVIASMDQMEDGS